VAPAAYRERLPGRRHASVSGRARARPPRRRRAHRRRGGGRRRDARARAVIGLFGGAFDPPHNGHVALARAAKQELGLERLLVLVSADPGHKRVETPAAIRLELARAAFPDDDVQLDEHARTVDLLRAHPEWTDPVFVVGADEFAGFLAWKE